MYAIGHPLGVFSGERGKRRVYGPAHPLDSLVSRVLGEEGYNFGLQDLVYGIESFFFFPVNRIFLVAWCRGAKREWRTGCGI